MKEFIIPIQIPIVLSLLILSIQAYKTLSIKEFKFISLAWALNLSYLCLKMFEKLNIDKFTIGSTCFDLLSTYFFLIAVRPIGEKAFRVFKKVSNNVVIIIFIFAAILKIAPNLLFQKTEFIPYIIGNIPIALIDFLVIIFLAYFFKKLTKEYYQSNFLFWGTFIYACIQFLAIPPDNALLPGTSLLIENIGFFLGMVSKLIILFSLLGLLITVGKEFANKEEIASRLDNILGTTFHEITYPLNAMENYLQNLLPDDKKKAPTNIETYKTQIEQIETSYNHLRAIVSASITMYETDTGKTLINSINQNPLHSISVNTIIEIAVLKIKLITQQQVEFAYDYGGNCHIKCDPYQLIQVFLNLFKNAFEAFPGNTGTIKIKTRIDRVENKLKDGRPMNKQIKINIEDNGTGIDEKDKPEVFKIGFSTKSPGRGFGMAIIKSLVEGNNGTVEFHSPTDNNADTRKGTIFTLIFPKVDLI